MSDMEDELDAAESRLEELTTQSEEMEKTADENDQARKILANRGRNDVNKIESLQNELNDHNAKISDFDGRYEQYTQESRRHNLLSLLCQVIRDKWHLLLPHGIIPLILTYNFTLKGKIL